MNPFDILGSLMQGGMGPSAGRLQNTFGQQGFGIPGGMPGAGNVQGGGTPGAMFDMLGKIAGGMLGGGQPSAQGGGLPFDMLKTIGSAVFGGQPGPGAGAGPATAGAGAMSVFGALAAQALEFAKASMSGAAAGQPGTGGLPFDMGDAIAAIAGLRKPANAREEQQVLDVAQLTIRAMINAAKADGRIDEQEAQRLLGKMQEDGVTEEERAFVMAEIQKPMETEAIASAVPNQQVAAQVYTASLMAISVDTDAEKRYLRDLAGKLGLNQQAVAYLHQAVGVA
jgi:uncharacterized membrane protein YebE (DUF533 family)